MKKLIVLLLLATPICLWAQEKETPRPVISVSEPLYVLNGKQLPSRVPNPKDSTQLIKPLDLIDPSTIEKMNVLKGLTATEKYGEAGKNGVVEIFTRKNFSTH